MNQLKLVKYIRELSQRVKKIEDFLDESLNYRFHNPETQIGSKNTKENPQAVKPTGRKCPSCCYSAKPGKILIDMDGFAGYNLCQQCDGTGYIQESPTPAKEQGINELYSRFPDSNKCDGRQ